MNHIIHSLMNRSYKYQIKFLNANKNYSIDIKQFLSYEKAIKWGKKNIPNFNLNSINIIFT
jgi:hypothetical protein